MNTGYRSRESNRRLFLKAASGLLAAPLLSSGRSSFAQSTGKAPLRFLTILDTYGVPLDNRERLWTPSRVGDYALESDSIGSILQPLSGHLEKLLVVSGADHRPSNSTFSIFHHGTVVALTASKATGNEPNHRQQNASIDFAVAEYLTESYGLHAPRAFPHLYLSDAAQPDKISACAGIDGVPIRSIAGHENIIRTLFSGISADGAGQELLNLDNESRRLALSLAESRIQALRPELVQANASQVLDAYQSSVQELATQLEAQVGVSCSPPSVGSEALAANDGRRVAHTLDAIFHAFACDLTSSVLYTPGGEVESFLKHSFLADPSAHSASTIDHLGLNLHASTHGNTPDEQKVQELVRRYHMELIAELVERMSVTPDVDGNMLIDNTVIYLPSGLSNNTHQWGDFCTAIIAGKNTNLRGGFHYDLSGQSVNDLLTTVGQGLTAPMSEFGGLGEDGSKHSEVNNGPIDRMLKEIYS